MSDRGSSDSPRTVCERACDAALKAAEASLEAGGAEPVTIFVTLHALGVPADELDGASAGHGFDDARDLLAELLGTATAAAKQLGLRLDVIPNLGPQGEG